MCEISGHETGGVALSERSIQYSRGEPVGKKSERVKTVSDKRKGESRTEREKAGRQKGNTGKEDKY